MYVSLLLIVILIVKVGAPTTSFSEYQRAKNEITKYITKSSNVKAFPMVVRLGKVLAIYKVLCWASTLL